MSKFTHVWLVGSVGDDVDKLGTTDGRFWVNEEALAAERARADRLVERLEHLTVAVRAAAAMCLEQPELKRAYHRAKREIAEHRKARGEG